MCSKVAWAQDVQRQGRAQSSPRSQGAGYLDSLEARARGSHMFPSGGALGYVLRCVVSPARASDQARPIVTHLAREIGGDALVIMQVRRILGVDEGEPTLPG